MLINKYYAKIQHASAELVTALQKVQLQQDTRYSWHRRWRKLAVLVTAEMKWVYQYNDLRQGVLFKEIACEEAERDNLHRHQNDFHYTID